MCVDSHAKKKKAEEKPNKMRERAQGEIMGLRPLPSAHLHPSRHTAHGEPVPVPNLRSVVGGSSPYARASP
jgi:hypothetical protein